MDVKERGILFSASMVRAILDGQKTQTRRALKPQPPAPEKGQRVFWEYWPGPERFVPNGILAGFSDEMRRGIKCPYGAPGDGLWVRETWGWSNFASMPPSPEYKQFLKYAARDDDTYVSRWRPSIHLPRWASRINLKVKSIRVERLQDISEEDAEAEGVQFMREIPDADETLTAKQLFEILWDSINEKRGLGWKVNPWVWAVEWPKYEEAAR